MNNQNFDNYFNQGLDLMNSDSWEPAIDAFAQALKLDPKSSLTYCNRGRCYWQLGKLEDAREDLKQALDLNAANIEDWIALGELNCQMGAFEEALQVFIGVKEHLAPDDSRQDRERVFSSLAYCQLELSQITDALLNVEEAILYAAPHNPWLLEIRANARSLSGNLEGALDDLNVAIVHDKASYSAYLARAEVRRALMMDEDTISQDLLLAFSLAPDDSDTRLDVGTRMMNLGSQHAETCFTQVINANPNNIDARLLRAYWFCENEPLRAIRDADYARQLAPDNAYTHMMRGAVLMSLNDTDAAVESMQEGVALEPHNAEYQCTLGEVFLDARDFQESLTCFELALKIDEHCLAAYTGRGNLFLKLGDYQSVLQESDLIRSRDPNNPSAYELKGEAHTGAGQFDVAIEAYQAAANHTLLPTDRVRCLAKMARVYILANRISEAAETLQLLNSMDSNQAELCQAHAEFELAHGRLEQAASYIEQAVDLDARSGELFEMQGNIEKKRGNISKAKEAFLKALGLESSPKQRKKIEGQLASLSEESV